MATSRRLPKMGRRPSRGSSLSSPSEKARASLQRSMPSLPSVRISRRLLLSTLILLMLAGGGLWYSRVYNSPQRVFDTMIIDNLALSGITRQVSQPVCLSTSGSSVNLIQINYFPQLQARCVTQIVNNSTKPPSLVSVESVGTRTADYEHYASINKPGSNPSKYGEIYNLWLKNGVGSSSQQLLIKSLFNPILFGDIQPPQRAAIAHQLRQAYSVDNSRIQKTRQAGRTVYGYNVTVNLVKFSRAWNSYAAYLGFKGAYLIPPGTYRPDQHLNINIQIDARSRQVRSVNFQGVGEAYGAYGISRPVSLPTKTYSPKILQDTLNSIK